MSTVLVTGGSGFVGSHAVVRLLAEGHAVRTTVRDRAREADVKKLVTDAGARADRLDFAVADLVER
jgi:dihydroflavonol-4-reductase